MEKIAYICDRKKDCGRFEKCQNTCFHTTDTFHTANGIIQSIHELQTDRFRFLGTINEVDYYLEVMKNGEERTLDERSSESEIPDVDKGDVAGRSCK